MKPDGGDSFHYVAIIVTVFRHEILILFDTLYIKY